MKTLLYISPHKEPTLTAREVQAWVHLQEIERERRKWNKQIGDYDTEVCKYCGKLLDKEIDHINGIEWICNNRYCPRKVKL